MDLEEVLDSQKFLNTENESIPLLSQSQPGSSNQLSQPGPSNRLPQTISSEEDSLPGPSNQRPRTEKESTPPFGPQKRRGRRPRNSNKHQKPTRESQRERKCPKVLNYESFNDSNQSSLKWNDKEKFLLFAGFLEVGVEDIEGLRQFLPFKSKDNIKAQIEMWKDLAHRKLVKGLDAGKEVCGVDADTLKNLNDWLKYFEDKGRKSDSESMLSNYFSILAEYGEFPPPDECGGIDMKAIYHCIHGMMNGIPPHGLNRVSAAVLLYCLDNVLDKLNNPSLISRLQDHVTDQSTKPDDVRFGKTYSRKGKNTSAKDIDRILRNSIINPLNLSDVVMTRVFEDSDSDDEN